MHAAAASFWRSAHRTGLLPSPRVTPWLYRLAAHALFLLWLSRELEALSIGTGAVTVTDGDPGPLPPSVPPPPGAVITDPVTGNVYVTNLFGPDIAVVDPPAGTGASVVDRSVPGTDVDYGTGNVFVTNIGGGQVTVVR